MSLSLPLPLPCWYWLVGCTTSMCNPCGWLFRCTMCNPWCYFDLTFQRYERRRLTPENSSLSFCVFGRGCEGMQRWVSGLVTVSRRPDAFPGFRRTEDEPPRLAGTQKEGLPCWQPDALAHSTTFYIHRPGKLQALICMGVLANWVSGPFRGRVTFCVRQQ